MRLGTTKMPEPITEPTRRAAPSKVVSLRGSSTMGSPSPSSAALSVTGEAGSYARLIGTVHPERLEAVGMTSVARGRRPLSFRPCPVSERVAHSDVVLGIGQSLWSSLQKQGEPLGLVRGADQTLIELVVAEAELSSPPFAAREYQRAASLAS